jgi:dTDP-4-amino-4,6-dideoxygalactose transaminase
MDALLALAKDRGLRVVEDAGARHRLALEGKPIGAFGDIATFSFHPNKNMTTIEGGAAVFASHDEAKRAEGLRFHGIRRLPTARATSTSPAEIQPLRRERPARPCAARQLEAWCAHRRALAERYFARLKGRSPVRLPARAHAGRARWT